jgi:hypothetical protein
MALNRAIFSLLVPQFVAQGLGANAILRSINPLLQAIPEVGVGIQRQWGLDEIRRIGGKMKLQDAVEAWAEDVRPGRHLMVETELKQAYKYRVYGSAMAEDVETGEISEHAVSMYTDNWIDKTEWEKEYLGDKALTESDPRFITTGVRWQSIEHNVGMAY